MLTKNIIKNAQQFTNTLEIKNVTKQNAWQERIQKRCATHAKLTALCVCIVSMVGIGLKAIFSKWKKHEVQQQPKDYADKRWSDLDWATWLQNNRDKWD